MKKILFLLLSFFHYLFSFSQTDSCALRISLLTCSPGQELYSTFGHSAIRVVDHLYNTDIIFNYGTFDFDDPDFYTKFIRGKLLYFVSADDFSNFVYEYQYEKRGIIEQVLNLSCTEKHKLFAALKENLKEQNKYYKYDFVYDNCTTRLRDIVAASSEAPFSTKEIRPYANVTFRNLIHEYLNRSKQYWSKLGIDILLGKPLDKKISNSEAMFLPDYLLKAFDSTVAGNKKLITEKVTILNTISSANESRIFTPMVVFVFLLLIVALLSFSKSVFIKKALTVFDFLFFFILGLTGVLLLFMWFGTDHLTCKQNFNLLWALPSHLVMAFFIHKKTPGVLNYFRLIFYMSIALIFSWFLLPQQLNPALLPVTAIILIRSFFLHKK